MNVYSLPLNVSPAFLMSLPPGQGRRKHAGDPMSGNLDVSPAFLMSLPLPSPSPLGSETQG
jgi:hypothetical protein